jgi:hypothetical protein
MRIRFLGTRSEFEGPASRMVHEGLGIGADAAGSREFWLWLTFVAGDGMFADLVKWRFGTQKSIDLVNYGIGRRSEMWEGLFARLWWRGNTGYAADAPEPYEIAARGDADLWRSHIIRQEYGRCRPVARALVEYQYPTPQSKARLEIVQLRALAKRLRIVEASVGYELLCEEDIGKLIKEYVEQIKSSQDSAALG